MSVAPLLVELLTEELPPKALQRLGESLASGIADALGAHALLADGARIDAFATPRRLAVRIDAVLELAPDRAVEIKGPSVKVGLDGAGQPTVALRKWAEKQHCALESLVRASDGKQECFFLRTTQPGARLADVIQATIEQAVAHLPVPRLMQYQLADGRTTVSFARPAKGLVVLHGPRVLPVALLGLQAGRATRGHRFLSAGTIEIADPHGYESALQSAHVMPSFDARRRTIAALLAARASELGATIGDDPAVAQLLDEVTALVEWPAVYAGRFDDAFLAVPQECLILTMRTNQKYFPLFDASGRLLSRFLIVSNMAIDEPSAIVDGNERVVRPRLADARFFFDQDRRSTLASRVERLGTVVYHAKLGTQGERVQRVRAIARGIARLLGADVDAADRAALLAKADLLTGMVGEFPELQGVMGRYYARHDGETEAVAIAIEEQYRPRFAGDALPASDTGTVLALADKLETLAGLFAIGQHPSGDRDPFALRRHALGVIRMVIERHLDLDVSRALGIAFDAFAADHADARAALTDFLYDRLVGYLRDRGFSANEVSAVVALRPERLATVPARLAAVREFASMPQSEALAAANKRIGNLLRKAGGSLGDLVDRSLLGEAAERELADTVDALSPRVDEALARADFTTAMTLMASARAAVDRFFDAVMVMADDARVRDNRLALLAHLSRLMNRVADISKLA